MDKMIRLLMLFQNYCPPIGRGKGIDGLYMNQNLRSRKDKETKALSQKKKAVRLHSKYALYHGVTTYG